MEIKTKYNLGDKFYQINGNKPTEFEIISAKVEIDNNEKRVWYGLKWEDKYGVSRSCNGIREDILESDYYRSKSALMLVMFPDLFKEAKGVYLLSEEGGEQ